VGTGVTIVSDSISYTGANQAAGIFQFTDDHDVIGISSGIILSSGTISDVEGPNDIDATTTDFINPGDSDLDTLSGYFTLDAAILEFEFEAAAGADKVYFSYVFGSEEYNEFVYSEFNDVFAFYVNGVNYATVEGSPVSINTINNGQWGVPTLPANPSYYINNDPWTGDYYGYTVPVDDLIYTEMDGFTVKLVFEAPINPGSNTMKLAIADTSDGILDSWVFIEGGSFGIISSCVSLVKEADVESAGIGDTITYTYTVSNCGSVTLSALSVVDDMLGGIELGSSSLAPGGSTTGVGSYVVGEGDFPGPVVNNADVSGVDPLGDPVSASASESVDIILPDLDLGFVDIKPGSCPNPLNTRSKGVLPAAILGTDTFNVMDIDPSTVRIGREGGYGELAALRYSIEDVATPYESICEECCDDRNDCHTQRADGFMDLTVKFSTKDVVESLLHDCEKGDVICLYITATTISGEVISGQDVIWIR
jgi:uncharacterized repeat protein (TIGR01451 family)